MAMYEAEGKMEKEREKVSTIKTPWGPLGEVIYLRTYSRWLEEEGRRETWPETVDRVVRYSESILRDLGMGNLVSDGEMRTLRTAMEGLWGFVAGRTLWVGGSPRSREFPLANYNCSFLDFKAPEDAYEAVVLLMSGAGVGFRVTEDNVENLNRTLPLKDFVEVEVEPYRYVGSPGTAEDTVVEVSEDGETMRMVVGDSREGWAQSIVFFLQAYSRSPGPLSRVKKILVNVDRVRPLGERLRRFGGYASGPQVLVDFYLDAQRVLSRAPHSVWTQTKALDVMNLIGRTVVAGGTRRCLPAGTPVLTREGPKAIEEVLPGDEVMTLAGYRTVVERMYNGEDDLVDVVTDQGTLRCTPNHRVATLVDGGGVAWIEAGKLTEGSRLLFYAAPWPGGNDSPGNGGEGTETSPFSGVISRVRSLLLLVMDHSGQHAWTREGRDVYGAHRFNLYGFSGGHAFLDRAPLLHTLGVGVSAHSGYVVLRVPVSLSPLVDMALGGEIPDDGDIAQALSLDEGGVFLPARVLLVRPAGRGEVYDLSVGDMHMFVAGGFLVHNSAQIALGTDQDFVSAKTGNWWESYPWRTSSNNSVMFFSRPPVSDIEDLLDMAMQYGEPGFINAETASIRRSNFRGVNPCSEILLDDSGVCNLATLVLPRFISSDGKVDYDWMFAVARALTRHAIRIALLRFPEDHFNHWNVVQERDRLIGISFTGYGDFVDQLGLTPNQQADILSKLRQVIHREAREYSALLGIREPILKTTVKPEGTLSLLPGVSSGIHPNFSRYYLRRVRMSKADAVAQALKALGMTPHPAPETGAKSLEEAHTWVYEFPVSSPAIRPQVDYGAIEQLERYKLAMEHYADHNVSITVLMEPREIKDVARWIHSNWYSFVGVSFLRKSRDVYPLMPLEETTEEVYRISRLLLPDLSRLGEVVNAIERGEYRATDDFDPSCASGICPVR